MIGLLPSIKGLTATNGGAPIAPVAGYRNWYDASQLALSNNDPVVSWTDLSGNGFSLGQTTAGNRPLFKTNVLNGKPAILFDGSNDFLSTTDIFFPTGYQHTVFMVLPTTSTPPTSPSASILFDTNNSGALSRRNGYAYVVATVPKLGFGRAGGGGSQELSFTVGESVVYGVKTDGAASFMRLNGDTGRQATFTISTNTTASVGSATVGGSAPVSGSYWIGYIAELIIYASALSATDFGLNEAYLKAKYGIT